MGRNDYLIMTNQRHDDRNVATVYKPVTRRSTRRRRTKTPVRFMASARVAVPTLVRGTSLRMTYLLGSIRVHQSGGLPIHAASTRHPSHPRPPPLSVVAAISSASRPFVLGLTPCGRCALTPETLPPLSMDGEPTPKPAPLNNFQSPLDRPFHIRTVGAVRRGLGKHGCGHDRPTERHRRGGCGGYAPSTISCRKRVAAA